jgi:cell division protein FtsB
MPEDKKVKSDDVKDAMAQSEHSMSLPKRDKSKKVWVILFVITLLALIGLGVYGYIKVQNDNKKIKDQQAQIDDLTNKKKTLEDAAAKAATAVAQVVTNNYLEVKELGFKLPLSSDIKDLQYFVNDKSAYFSTASLQSSAWPSANNDAAKFCSIGSLPLGVITKFANASDAGPTQQKALSGFVLGYAPPQSSCSANQATINLQNTQKASLQKAFENAVKI